MRKVSYRIGIIGPNTEYAVDENDHVLQFETEEEATAKLTEFSGEYSVIPVEYREAGE